MSAFKRIIAGSLAIATIFANIVSAAADVSSDSGVKVGWWTSLLHNLAQRSDGLSIMEVPYGSWICSIVADMSGTVCEFSEDHWHHADESDYLKVSEGDDGTYAVRAKCKYCHKEFVATGLTAADLSDKYAAYASSLPASGYNSAGALLWQPNMLDATISSTDTSGSYKHRVGFQVRYSLSPYTDIVSQNCDTLITDDAASLNITGAVDGAHLSLVCADAYGSNKKAFQLTVNTGLTSGGSYVRPRVYFRVPIAGIYETIGSTFCILQSETPIDSGAYTATEYKWGAQSVGTYGVNGLLWADLRWYKSDGTEHTSRTMYTYGRARLDFYTPVFKITPTDSTIINNNYTINTRVNNFNGDYYDSVTNSTYNNTTIVNETTNNYYDFTTNTTYPMQSWSYDYQSRTYFITLEDGTTVTVQFGDDCLTITNNNVSNSYQYVIKNNGGSDTPSACKHDWKETIDVEPTCLEGGHASYTCSLCGETYEQLLAAKGHDWKVKEHVNTVYGENGEVVTQGHTLYECAVCGEQWYTDTASPPPDTSGGNILAWLESFKSWLGDKLDNLFHGDTNNFWDSNKKTFTDMLSSLLQTLLDFLTNILEKLLGLITDLLSFFFDLLSSTVIAGISAFFSALKDAQLFSFFQKDDSSEVALPDGIATVFAFFSGVILALPVELRSLLLLGTAIVVLIGVINIIKS